MYNAGYDKAKKSFDMWRLYANLDSSTGNCIMDIFGCFGGNSVAISGVMFRFILITENLLLSTGYIKTDVITAKGDAW